MTQMTCRVWVEKKRNFDILSNKDKCNILLASDLVNSCKEMEYGGLCEGETEFHLV